MISAPILYFLLTIASTLAITAWAARAGSSRASLYAASGRISASQNGLAIAGETLSAGALLGAVGLYLVVGVDMTLYSLPGMAGFCLLLILIVRPLRQMGRYTLGDVVGSRLPQRRVRAVLGACTVTISLIYMVAQLVGAGALISIVFGLTFNASVVVVGALMAIYVTFGGMLAATWVQIIKAGLLIGMVVLLAALAIGAGGGLSDLYAAAGARSQAPHSIFAFGALDLGLFSSVSLTASLLLGLLGMPHLLIRFFTVPDEHAAKRSLVIATTIQGSVLGLIFLVIGPAAVAFLTDEPWFRDESGAVAGGPNMVVLHLARFLGGNVLFGMMGAVAFSTILAVVAGLTVAISSATSHDLMAAFRARPLREKAELTIFRLTAMVSSAVAVALATLFQQQNLTFLIIMGFTVAASTNFPLLILTIYWPKLTAAGAVACGLVGLITSVGLIIAGPACWVQALGFATPIFPSDYPALISMPLAFAAAWIVSRATRNNERAAPAMNTFTSASGLAGGKVL